ncbi:P-selectin-like isoform X1 [Mytilus edulis]|uniref:P-selectin-like isoform X1 n=1 Tax=Mytilus edulis TaxID=6550 RepID=UPI0039EF9689
MFNCWYVIVIALSIYHEVNAEEKLTRQCAASQGRCAKTKDSNCESSFGSGWINNGSCCRRKPCCVFQCEDIPSNNLTNGAVTIGERTIGSTANFTCDAGHLLVGNETITCTSSGWNGNIPQCRFQCEDIPSNNLTNGAITVTERTIGSTAIFRCHAGHSLVGNETITCTSSGWNGNIPQCRFQCEDIPSNNLTNGAVTVTERTIGSTANFTCDAGHSLVGNEIITCTSSGWNGNIPQCRFQCDDIPTNSLTNGAVIVAERYVGSTANFTCDAGLSVVGRKSITCTTSGWNGNIPQCRFQCDDIPTNSLTNGTVTVKERTIGSTANFICHRGFVLVGRKSITCTTSGWDGNIPQCILANISCPETVAFFRGSKYIFTCNLATWSNSKANCNVLGGHLTSVETGDENAFLVDVVRLMHKHIEQILYAFFWIGLTDNNDEMSYKWLSGEPLNYSDWYQGSPQQPDNKNIQNKQGAHCAMIHPFYFLKWGDEFCSELANSVCEIRLT